ncbi:MAG TPA: CocE/NonD family hydrolase [Frankiaceae bacterium]|nr:CocE/NonD family hydrolase [Frankiaceae bacterium]
MRRVALALAALVLAALPVPASAATTYEETYIASADGTRLHTEIFRKRTGRLPVALIVSPYLHGDAYLRGPEAEALLDRGYAVVQTALRGYGGSDGCSDLGGKGEQSDVKAAVEWAARQSWSTGRVGMWGLSYEGWTQVMALATRPRGLAAVAIQSPLVSLYHGLYMNRAHYGGVWWAMPASYGADDLGGTGSPQPTDATCYAANLTETTGADPDTAYYRERDLIARARTSRVPVLWSHGFNDVNTKPDNLSALYPLLRGPKRAWVGQFPHVTPPGGVGPRYLREVVDWFDAYVRGDRAALRRVTAAPRAVVQQGDGRWRTDSAWPPRDARAVTSRLRSGTFTDIPANDGSQGHEDGAVLWSFSQRLPYAVHLSGAPRVTVTVRGTAPAQVVVKVYDVGPEGEAVPVTRGVHALVDGKASFELYPQDWRFAPGHRIGVAVLGSDGTFWSPAAGGQVTVSGASLAVPALRYERGASFADTSSTKPAQFTVVPDVVKAGETTFRLPPRMRP